VDSELFLVREFIGAKRRPFFAFAAEALALPTLIVMSGVNASHTSGGVAVVECRITLELTSRRMMGDASRTY
jgi:hypothetical protein